MDQPTRSIRRGLGLDQWSWILKMNIATECMPAVFQNVQSQTWQAYNKLSVGPENPSLPVWAMHFCCENHAEVSLHMLQLWWSLHLHSLWTGADVHPSAQSAGQCWKWKVWDEMEKIRWSVHFFRWFFGLYIFLAGIEKWKLYWIYGYFRGLTMAFRGLLPVCV